MSAWLRSSRMDASKWPQRLAVDFDGTIAVFAMFPELGEPLPGAIEALWRLKDEGWDLLVYSYRAELPGGREQILRWLDVYGAPPMEVSLGKPQAIFYVDDQAVKFKDWEQTYSEISQRFKNNQIVNSTDLEKPL